MYIIFKCLYISYNNTNILSARKRFFSIFSSGNVISIFLLFFSPDFPDFGFRFSILDFAFGFRFLFFDFGFRFQFQKICVLSAKIDFREILGHFLAIDLHLIIYQPENRTNKPLYMYVCTILSGESIAQVPSSNTLVFEEL